MSARHVELMEARAKLEELIERAARGEEIIITRRGAPLARLVALISQEHIEAADDAPTAQAPPPRLIDDAPDAFDLMFDEALDDD